MGDDNNRGAAGVAVAILLALLFACVIVLLAFPNWGP